MKKPIHTLFIISVLLSISACKHAQEIDRFALVTRHNIHNTSIDSLNSLSVGNGEFAFTVDITGLQTFPDYYAKGISLGTMSNWGWHTWPNPENYQLSDNYVAYNVHGRQVDYVHQFSRGEDTRKIEASNWLRANPHRIHLGMIGLQITRKDGTVITLKDISNPVQDLDLWTGILESNFIVDGVPVKVITVCHPDNDMISVKISSELISMSRLKIKIHFPLGVSGQTGYDFNQPDLHTTNIISDSNGEVLFERIQDNDRYYVKAFYGNSKLAKGGPHLWYIEPDTTEAEYEFSCCFTKSLPGETDGSFDETENASSGSWHDFWSTGGAVDFSGCTDTRAFELERRVILSEYLTKIQCSGSLPPAETGLTYNTWYGKFHLEMHWWHAVHFALWQREDILEKQMEYYSRIIDRARQTAEHQGYDGVRWPKMTDPDGRESPSSVGTYLIWQQPHFIFFAELLYRNAKNKEEVLNKYKDIVFETAEFMASYAWYDSKGDRYTLGPILIPAQESLSKETTVNPPFELVYWYWGLKTAQEWKRRAGEMPVALWVDITKKISKLSVLDGLYLCSEDTKDSYQNPRYMSDHPIVSGIKGVMPDTRLVDDKILGNSLDTIVKKWNWNSTWGWDFPMLAMSAASIGRAEQAVDFLLMDAPKNRYLLNGHNFQDPSRLAIYLPGNGGLLTAIAKMCVYDQFPHNGKWNVRWENLNKYVE
jgi:hypothetical protein